MKKPKVNSYSSPTKNNLRLVFFSKLERLHYSKVRRYSAIALPILTGAIIWLLPSPHGVSEQAWHLLAIFSATIVSFITKPLPIGVFSIFALVIIVLTKTLTLEEGLSGFGTTTSWLTLCSFFIARGILKTGLGTRIAYLFMSVCGKSTLLLSYGMLATDLVLSPAIPSGNARAGGIMFPLVKSLATAYGSESDDGTSGRIGRFLMQTAYQGTQITTAMFLTAMVSNPFMAEISREMGIEIDWMRWALAALVPGLLCSIAMPLIVYFYCPPQIEKTPEASQLAKIQLTKIGKMSDREWLMLVILAVTLFFWIFGDRLGGIESATSALMGVALLLGTKVLTWQDLTEEHKAWDIFVWFSIILMMATYLNRLGFIPWISKAIGDAVVDFPWQIAFFILSIIYFYSNYFFASKAARASAMYPAFLSVALALGTPPLYAVLILTAFVNLSGCLTHYGTAEAPIYFSAGYIETTIWCKIGFVLSIVYIAIWLIFGTIWWQILGFVKF